MENYYKELPEGYKEVFHIDARNKKTGLLFTLSSLGILAIVMIPILLTVNSTQFAFFKDLISLYMFGFAICLLLYLVLHELTHGVVYKAMTKQKLTFGMSWSCAFCGVPDIYVSRKTALCSLLAPFTLFTLLLLPLTIVLAFVDPVLYVLCGLLFGLHFGGCIGDLYMTVLLLFKYKDPCLLMRDTGPEQFLYLPENK